jgi:hypothetical protein
MRRCKRNNLTVSRAALGPRTEGSETRQVTHPSSWKEARRGSEPLRPVWFDSVSSCHEVRPCSKTVTWKLSGGHEARPIKTPDPVRPEALPTKSRPRSDATPRLGPRTNSLDKTWQDARGNSVNETWRIPLPQPTTTNLGSGITVCASEAAAAGPEAPSRMPQQPAGVKWKRSHDRRQARPFSNQRPPSASASYARAPTMPSVCRRGDHLTERPPQKAMSQKSCGSATHQVRRWRDAPESTS